MEKCTAGATAGTSATNPTGTLYWTGTGSDPLVETDLAGNVLEDYVFFNGQRIARREPDTTPTQLFYFSDHLGTHSLVTDKNGTMPPQSESDYYPYGGEISIVNTDPNNYKFTGKERDIESGLDNFGARFDASSLGRFMSPDDGAYDLGNPQSLNAYPYVLNNPLLFVDPDGRQAEAVVERAEPVLEKILPVIVGAATGAYIATRETVKRGVQRTAELLAENPNTWGSSDGPVPIQFQEDTSTDTASSGNAKRPGMKGNPDHQEGVQADTEDLRKEAGHGEQVRTDRKVQGLDSNRRPDNQIVGSDGKTRKIIERERLPNSKRNKEREAEYDRLGIKHETRPVKRNQRRCGGSNATNAVGSMSSTKNCGD